MRWQEQGTTFHERHSVIPRTLCFILHAGNILLLRGSPDKRLWAGKLNGIGGHIEADETPYEGARRELKEEAGLASDDLCLRGIVHIASDRDQVGIMIFVYVGSACSAQVQSGSEGELGWYPLHALPSDEMVADLPELIPRVIQTAPNQIVYGLYRPADDGSMSFSFSTVG
ncbi:MAG: NUDIX hydrolase [Anaerolineae bacterium]